MAKSSKSSHTNDPILLLIINFLTSTPEADFQRAFPEDHSNLTAWYYFKHNWIEDGSDVWQSVTMLNETAQRYFNLLEVIFEMLTKRKRGTQLPEKVVTSVLNECVARYIHASTNDSLHAADSLVTNIINTTLLASPHPFQVVVPVYGILVDSPTEFRGIRYSRPKDCPEYVDRMSRLIGITIDDPDDPNGNELNDGSFALAFVKCEARFDGEALNIANRLVSRDLSILKYAIYRESQSGYRWSVPGITNWKKFAGRLSTIVISSRGTSTTHVAGFSGVDSDPVVLTEWKRSKWFRALEYLVSQSEQSDRRMAHQVIDALAWLGRSTSEDDDTSRLLYQITALETLLPIDGKEEKAQQVRLLTSLLGGMAGMNKQRTFDLVQRAYTTRSEIVHGSTISISTFEPDRMERVLNKIVDHLLFTSAGKQILLSEPSQFKKELYALILGH